MVRNASAFKCDVSKWDTSKVTDVGSMLSGASAYTGVTLKASAASIGSGAGSSHSDCYPVQLHSMGILGLGPSDNGAPLVDPSHVLVDPAGLYFITSNTPGDARFLSEALYDFVGIRTFPDDVRQQIQKQGDAAYHKYGTGASERHVIHVVGPDFGSKNDITWHDAIEELKKAYVSVIRVAERLPSEVRVVRIPLISGGVFAGKFSGTCVPELTARAVVCAIDEVTQLKKKTTKRVLAVHVHRYGAVRARARARAQREALRLQENGGSERRIALAYHQSDQR